jgi:hypothetical protein
MAATYTFDVFMSLDGYGGAKGNWSGYWGKQGPELLNHRLDLYSAKQRMIRTDAGREQRGVRCS